MHLVTFCAIPGYHERYFSLNMCLTETRKVLVVWKRDFTSEHVNLHSDASKMWQLSMYLKWNVMTLGDLFAGC